MKSRSLLALSLLATSQISLSQPSAGQLSSNHDGRWTVVLQCPDTNDKTGLVKGYEYSFVATVDQGNLHAEYGTPGTPGSVVYDGSVLQDGSLAIKAKGVAGNSAFAAGRVAQGTPYVYNLRGTLGKSGGQAVRVEARPCTATFTKR